MNTSNYMITDQKQALLQLELLGYKPGDKIYLRSFPGKDETGKRLPGYAHNDEATYPNLPWEKLNQWQEQHNSGIYFVVNGQGQKQEDIKTGRAIFCEWDDHPIEWQLTAYRDFDLPEPSFQVQTRKSVHNYWVFESPVNVEEWKGLQTGLLSLTKSDQALKDASRVMRLAGFYHVTGGQEPIICQIISGSTNAKTYSYEELRQIIPHTVKENLSDKQKTNNQVDTKFKESNETSGTDIRKFAKYLDGYNLNGRDGWITAKCPCQSGSHSSNSSNDSLHINKETGHFKCHAGCNSKDVYRAALNLAKERGFEGIEQDNYKNKLPKADTLGAEIAEDYRNKLLFNLETHRWMFYEKETTGIWTPVEDLYVESLVDVELENRGIEGYGSNSYITNIVSKIKLRLYTNKWDEKSAKDYLPFLNGVLEIATGKLLAHAPGYRLTWSLPRYYDPEAKDFCKINQWLDEATGNNHRIKKVILCFLNAILKGRSDLQMFLHTVGFAGTGKSTLLNLATALIGVENVRSTTLNDFCNNKFESANVYKKRLVLFADQDKYAKDLQKFKSLTGQDLINAEDKGKKGFQFKYDGMVIMASNKQIFVSDSSSWLHRRLILVPFNHPVDKNKRRNLEEEFQPELNALTNHLLSIPDQTVTEVLRNVEDNIPEIAEQLKEQRISSDSIAAWVEECVEYDPVASTSVGSNKEDENTLFGNYYQYCIKTASNGRSSKTFSGDLIDFCFTQGWNKVRKKRTNKNTIIYGLRLNRTKFNLFSDEEVRDECSMSEGLKSLQDKDRVGCEGLDPIFSEKLLELTKIKTTIPVAEGIVADNRIEDSTYPTQFIQDKDLNPTPDSTQCRLASFIEEDEDDSLELGIQLELNCLEAVPDTDNSLAWLEKQINSTVAAIREAIKANSCEKLQEIKEDCCKEAWESAKESLIIDELKQVIALEFTIKVKEIFKIDDKFKQIEKLITLWREYNDGTNLEARKAAWNHILKEEEKNLLRYLKELREQQINK